MTTHLDWRSITDLSGGMWTVDDWRVPANGAKQLLDCYPLPQGGIRAWAKFSDFSTNGIASTEQPIAFFARGGIPHRTVPATEGTDFYILTATATTGKLYRWDNTAAGTVTWTLLKTFTGRPVLGNFVSYYHAADATVHVYLVYTATNVDDGVWRIRYSDGNVANAALLTIPHSLIVFQQRLVVATGENNGARIYYSGVGDHVLTNTLDVAPSDVLTSPVFMRDYGGDLIIAKSGAPFQFLQGNIADATDQIIRQAGDSHFGTAVQRPASTEMGLFYNAMREGIFVTTTGVDAQRISESLGPNETSGQWLRGSGGYDLGTISYFDQWVCTPSGYIFDTRTRAWFRTSAWGYPSTPGKAQMIDRHIDNQVLYVATSPSSNFTIKYTTLLEDTMSRLRTYTYQSAPIYAEGRRTVMRQAELVLEAQASGASCAVTVNGVTRTVTGIASGRQVVPFPFLTHDEVVDLTIVPDSGADATEAPSIEAIRVGTLPGRLVR